MQMTGKIHDFTVTQIPRGEIGHEWELLLPLT